MADVEQRILEMKLDSSDLERNAESSIKTIQKLNSAMKFDDATKGFADLDKSIKNVNLDSLNKSIKGIDFNPLNASLQASANYLVSFGTTFKRVMYEEISRPIAQLPMKVANFAVKPLKLLGAAFDTIATKGKARATNIDQANFMLEGLGANIEEVGEAVSASVNGTAFGYDEAAKVASSFYATGIEDAKQMEEYLKGVVGVAAMTNSDLGSIGHIFTTIAGQGKVTREQLNQFAVKGLNVSADLAKELGKSEEEISKMISKGMIDFDTFATIMNKRYAEHAFKANETYEGSLANMKSALGRIGADFFAPMRDMMIPIFNRLKDIFNNIKQTMKDKGIYDGFTRLTENVTKLFTTIFGAPDSTDFWFLGWVDTLAEKASQAIDFVNGLIESAIGFFEPILGVGKEASEVAETVTETVQDIDAMANRVIAGEFGNDQERFDQLEKLGYNYKIVQNRVNELLGCSYRYEVTEEEMAAATEKNAEAQEKQATFMSKATEAQAKLQETAKGVVKQTRDYIKTIDKKSVFQKFQTALTGIGSLFSMVGSTVGAIVKGAWGGLLEAFKTIGGWILNAAAALGEWITKLETWMKENKVFESMQNGINKAMTKFNGALKTVGKVGGTAFDVLKAGGSKVSTLFTQAKTNASAFWEEFKQTSAYQRLSDIIEGIKQKFIELKDAGIQKVLDLIERFKGTEVKLPEFNAGSFAEAVSEKINWLLDRLTDVKTTIKTLFSGAGEGGATIGSSIKEFFESETLQDGISTVTGLITGAKDAILDFFSIFVSNDADSVADASESTKKAVDGLTDAAQNLSDDLMGGSKNKLHEFLDWLKEMSPTLKEVGSWVGKALGMFTAFKSLKGLWDILGWAGKIKGILGEVKGILKSVKKVISEFGNGVERISKALSSMGKAYAKNLKATALIKTAVAVGIFAAALWGLGQLSWDQLKVAAAGIAIITGALAVLIGVLGMSGAFGGKGKGGGGYAEKLGEFLAGIKEGVNKFLKKAGTAMMFGAFAAAIAILAHTLKTIGDMKWEQIAKGLAGILGIMGILMTAMALMAAITKLMGKDKFSGKQMAMMLALSASIMLVGTSIKKLGELSKSSLTKGLVAVGVISLVLDTMMYMSKHTANAKIGPIISMTVAIGGIALSMLAISLIPKDKLASVVTSLGLLMGAFSLMEYAAGKMNGGGAGMIAGIVLMGLVLAEVSAVLYIFTSDPNFDADKMSKISVSVSLMIGVLGAITLLCQWIGNSGIKGLASTALGALDITIITAIIGAVGSIAGYFLGDDTVFTDEKVERVERGIHIMGRILTALTTEFGQMIGGFFGGIIGGAVTGMVEDLPEIGNKLSQFVSNLGSLAEGEGPSFAGFKSLMGFLKDLVDMAEQNTMSDLWTKFIGNGSSSLVSFGTELNVFAVLMGKYSDRISGLDEETVTKTSYAISTVTKYANDVPEVGGLVELFTGDSSLITFGKEVLQFAVYMVAYANEISGMNADSVTMTSAAIGTVMQFANAAPTVHGSESLLGQIIGSNDLADLGASLITFAKGMVGYSWIVSQLNSIAVENSQKSVEIITALAKNIPGIRMENSIAGQIFGSNTFGALGSGLESFGRAMVAYSQIVGSKKFDTNAIENSKTSAGIITELARNVPNIHGKDTILSWFTGDNSLETLGTNITSFGESMVKFSETLGKIENMGDVEIMLDRLKNLVSLFGMFSDELVNYNTLNTREAVGNLEGEIEGMFEYFHDMWGDEYHVETLKADGAALWESVIEGFKDAAANKVTITDTMTSIFAAEDSVSKLKETGGNLATELINGLRLMIETDTLINTDVLTLVDTIITNVTTFITMRVKDFVAAVDLIKGNVLATIERTRYLLETKVKVLIDVALGKIDSSRDSFVHSVETIANNCVNAVGDYEDDFRNAGVNLIAGFEDGIASMARRAADAAAYVAISAYNAMTRVLEIHSPSKKGQYVGEMLDDGVSKGISDNEKLVSKSATSVGKSAVKSIKNQVLDARKEIFKTAKKTGKGIGTVVQNDLWLDDKTIKKTADKVNKVISNVDTKTSNTNPVITPILDTTKLKNGSKYVDDVLSDGTDTTYSANFTGSIDLTAITSSINQSSNTLGAKIDLTNQKISNLNNTLDSFNGPQNAVFLSLMYEMMGIYFPQFATLPEEDQETILSSQQMSARMAMLAKRAR